MFVNILYRIYDYLYLQTIPAVKGKILDELYNYTQYHNHKFFQDNLAGHITNRITEGARSFEMVLSILFESIVRRLAVIIFTFVTIWYVDLYLAIIFLIWLCCFIIISYFCASKINQYSTLYASNKALVAGKIVDSIANTAFVRIFTSHKFERRYLNNYIERMVASDRIMQLFMLKLRFVMGSLCAIMSFAMIYYLAILRGSLLISVGDCVLILTLCATVMDDVWELTQEIGDLFEEIGAFTQSASLIRPHSIVDVEGAKELIVTDGNIEFRNVTFHHSDDHNLFQNKSIIIHGRQKIGVVGFSGSGKSTFVSLINRSHDIDSGSILIDDQNIHNVSQDSLRRSMSIIPQEPVLFHRTIMENIRYGKKDASDEQVITSAKMAHIHEFIEQLPDGYNSLCGERGNNLSGGQRQRIVIARAILKNAPILILDEATSSLDSNTESLIQESLKSLMQNKTTLVIAHRLSTLLNMDRILVFDVGAIVGDGTHEELLKKNDLYKKLWCSQVKGFILDNH
jgi:ABC-type multidrug transport system fused ATPase/permease subunit